MGQMYVEYIIDITETEYEDTTGAIDVVTGKKEMYSGFEYRSMKTTLITGGMGAIWFKYDISPLKVHYTMYHQSWADFLVHLCAIVGGTFAAAGIIESILRNGFCLVVPVVPGAQKNP